MMYPSPSFAIEIGSASRPFLDSFSSIVLVRFENSSPGPAVIVRLPTRIALTAVRTEVPEADWQRLLAPFPADTFAGAGSKGRSNRPGGPRPNRPEFVT